MLKHFRTLLLCLCAALFFTCAQAQVVINEILAENATGLQDEDKERSDWIEIYNAGAAAVNLAGWSLTDEPDVLAKWKFPSTNIAGNGYVLVFASGKNRAVAGKQLHTSFKLSSGGEYLALVKPDGQTIASEFAPEFPQQNPNISYGLAGGSLTDLRFFATPSPNAANAAGASDLSAEPVFLVPGGAYGNSVTIQLAATQPGAVIRYTTTTNEPTAASTIYTSPLTFASTTIVRAKAFVPGLIPSSTVTRTYTILDTTAVNFNSNLPVLVLSTFGQAPSQDWPVAVSALLVGTNGTRAFLSSKPDFEGRGTIKIRGSSSTQFPKKSFAFEVQDELLLDRKVSLLGMPKESDWVLYAPYTDKTFMRDVLAYEMSNAIGTYAPRTRFIEVYVDQNGGKLTQAEYVGVYVLIEKIKRSDKRVDIAELLPTQTTQPEVTGGYIFKKDRLDPGDVGFSTSRAGGFAWVEPKEQQIVPSQKSYLLNYLSQFETALYAANFTNKTYANFYDVDAGIDHHLLVESCKNIDGYRLSTYVHKDRLGKVAMGPIWDYNLSLGNANYNDGFNTANWYYPLAGDYPWYTRLFQDPDFKQRYTDRWYQIRGGYFATTNILPRIIQIANVLGESAARDNAKWKTLGVYVWPNPDGYATRKTYRSEVDWMTNWVRGRFAWIDTQFTKAPALSHLGGAIQPGMMLTITNYVNPVYYTTDGSDPRLPGGAISPKATIYSGPFAINANTRVTARSYRSASLWSAPVSASYLIERPQLVITEIMYNPDPDPAKDYEFIELKNVGATPLDLKGFRFSNGIDFTFTNSLTLAPGGLGVLVKDPAAFTARFGEVANVAGQYTGALENNGERIVLEGPAGERMFDFSYNNAWYPATDGYGFSLSIKNERATSATWDVKESWRASASLGGSPGIDEPAVSRPTVLINEILTHTDAPQVDSIELYNPGATDVDISNWYLSDDRGEARKFKIPSPTVIRGHNYVVFTEDDFNKDPLAPTSFALSSNGDEIYLFSADAAGNLTGFTDGFAYGAAANGVSFGRIVTSDGKVHYTAQTSRTPSVANSAPAIGPVVINEIRYAPNAYEAEFVELKNISSQEVKLYDPDHPENTWKVNGLDFNFPMNVSIPAGGIILVVQSDPERFRAANTLPPTVPIYGPYSGALQDDGEMLQLLRPDAPETVNAGSVKIPMIVVDEVRYNDKAPWPVITSGGRSLERIFSSEYGDDPLNWRARPGAGSPGLDNPSSDWDAWRARVFTASELDDPSISGSSVDPDQDGYTNRDEFLAGTDPKSAGSALRLNSTGSLSVQFEAAADRTYTVYFRSSLTHDVWTAIGRYPATADAHTVQVENPQPGYYRLAVP